MKRLFFGTTAFIFGWVLLTSAPVYAGEVEDIKARLEELEKKVDAKKELGTLDKIADRITLRGAIELDYSYSNTKDISNPQSASKSEFEIGTVELGTEVKFHEWVTGNFILKGENLDSNNDRIFWDEASVTIGKDGFPVYLVAGKRAQPFGVFNSHLINDPITQDCYEVAKTGATVGFLPGLQGLDISATLYKGEILADKLSGAGYGWARDPNPNPDPTDQVNSYILNVSMEPMKDLKISAYLDSEPGQQDRNTTAGGSIEYTIANFTFDAEYIKALSREMHATNVKKHKESAWFTAIAYQVADPLEIALRYEGFDDDMTGDQDGHLTNRYSIGANYTLFKKDNFSTTLMVEYRRSNYEKAAGSAFHDKADELFARLAFAF
jgi:hypothetical protein